MLIFFTGLLAKRRLKITLVTTIEVKRLARIPIDRVVAKPFMGPLPN
jgi:hypothetical protein